MTSEDETLKFNFPYYMYPQAPCAGYFDIDTYNSELQRLHSETINMKLHKKSILWSYIAGAAMEEYLIMNDRDKRFDFQWQQLLPNHVREFAIRGGTVIQFIISPNISFSRASWIEPAFIKHTPEFNWKYYPSENKFISQTYDVTIFIFNTMMPTIDLRNEAYCERFSDPVRWSDEFTRERLKQYKQTEIDRMLTNQFYENLGDAVLSVKSNGGCITFLSFAVFNEDTNNSYIKKYEMFKEIKSIAFNIIAEWVFTKGSYCVIPIHNSSMLISYVDHEYGLFKDGYQIKITFGSTGYLFDIVPQKKSYNIPVNNKTCAGAGTGAGSSDNSFVDDSFLKDFQVDDTFLKDSDVEDDTFDTSKNETHDLLKEITYLKKECIANAIKIYKEQMLEYIFTLPWIKILKHKYSFNDDELIDTYSYIVGLSDDSLELYEFIEKYNLPIGINRLSRFEYLIISKKFNCEIIVVDNEKSTKYIHEDVTCNKKLIISIHNIIPVTNAFSCSKHDQT